MTTAFVIAALILSLIEEAIAHGKSLLGWAVVLVCIALLWGKL